MNGFSCQCKEKFGLSKMHELGITGVRWGEADMLLGNFSTESLVFGVGR